MVTTIDALPVIPVAPVVALHSSASTGAQWKALATALAGREVVTPDLPGYGRASFRDNPPADQAAPEIGSASRRERVCPYAYTSAVSGSLQNTTPVLIRSSVSTF